MKMDRYIDQKYLINSYSVKEISTAVMVILLNIVTDMVPYFSILEVKFIEIFRKNADIIIKRR